MSCENYCSDCPYLKNFGSCEEFWGESCFRDSWECSKDCDSVKDEDCPYHDEWVDSLTDDEFFDEFDYDRNEVRFIEWLFDNAKIIEEHEETYKTTRGNNLFDKSVTFSLPEGIKIEVGFSFLDTEERKPPITDRTQWYIESSLKNGEEFDWKAIQTA